MTNTRTLATRIVQNLLKASPNASDKEGSAPVRIDLTRMGYVAATRVYETTVASRPMKRPLKARRFGTSVGMDMNHNARNVDGTNVGNRSTGLLNKILADCVMTSVTLMTLGNLKLSILDALKSV